MSLQDFLERLFEADLDLASAMDAGAFVWELERLGKLAAYWAGRARGEGALTEQIQAMATKAIRAVA